MSHVGSEIAWHYAGLLLGLGGEAGELGGAIVEMNKTPDYIFSSPLLSDRGARRTASPQHVLHQ